MEKTLDNERRTDRDSDGQTKIDGRLMSSTSTVAARKALLYVGLCVKLKTRFSMRFSSLLGGGAAAAALLANRILKQMASITRTMRCDGKSSSIN